MSRDGFGEGVPARLQLWPLALGLIVFGTAVPVELRAPVAWTSGVALRDLVVNVLLYVPLGLCWRPRGVLAGALAAACLSGAIELLQTRYFGRQAAGADVLAN
ncbi:MAG TPA: hypothetical protein VFZ93_01400, partial [Albitalea sp.]